MFMPISWLDMAGPRLDWSTEIIVAKATATAEDAPVDVVKIEELDESGV
jgi:hypothetical protein